MLASLKLALGLPLVYLCLVGLDPQWSFGLLPAGSAGPWYALGYAVLIAIGLHCVLMGSFAWAGSRPPVWMRAVLALMVVGLGVGLGPAASEQYQAYERSAGKLPLYVSEFGTSEFIAFTPQNQGLFLVDENGKIDRWKFDGGLETLKGSDYGNGFWHVEFSPDNRRFLGWTGNE